MSASSGLRSNSSNSPPWIYIDHYQFAKADMPGWPATSSFYSIIHKRWCCCPVIGSHFRRKRRHYLECPSDFWTSQLRSPGVHPSTSRESTLASTKRRFTVASKILQHVKTGRGSVTGVDSSQLILTYNKWWHLPLSYKKGKYRFLLRYSGGDNL